MRQLDLKFENRVDENNNPTGGSVKGVGIDIQWQNGPLGHGENRQEPNGAFVEGVIEAAIQRLGFFQNSKFKCLENAVAIEKLQEALKCLESRTAARVLRNVEGTHQV